MDLQMELERHIAAKRRARQEAEAAMVRLTQTIRRIDEMLPALEGAVKALQHDVDEAEPGEGTASEDPEEPGMELAHPIGQAIVAVLRAHGQPVATAVIVREVRLRLGPSLGGTTIRNWLYRRRDLFTNDRLGWWTMR